MAASYDLPGVDRLVVGTVGPPGERVFYLQARQGRRLLTLKVEAAWRPDYVGTQQKRFFRFEAGKLLFGPAPNSIRRGGGEPLTRRLTLERASPGGAQIARTNNGAKK